MSESAGERPGSGTGALLSLTTTRVDGAVVVTATGELDVLTAPAGSGATGRR